MTFGRTVHLNKTGFYLLCIGLCLIFFWTYRTNYQSKPLYTVDNFLKVALRAAKNGGLEIVKIKDNLVVRSKGLTKEGMEDSVTTADYLSHCSMMKTLKYYYPDIEIISEESNVLCNENHPLDFDIETYAYPELPEHFVPGQNVTIWIDPLDATHEYTEKLYQYVSTMVCIAIDGRPIIGVIHMPFTDQTYWAWNGQIYSSNLRAKGDHHNATRIIISRSHSGAIKSKLNEKLKNFELIEAAGAGYKVVEVAKGNADAYLHSTVIKKWDICAGNAIIEAVGGRMTTKLNKLIDYKNSMNVVNDNGLVTTLRNHQKILNLNIFN